MTQFVGRLLGLEDVQSIDRVRPSLAAPWVQSTWGMALLIFGCLALGLVAVLFYARYQRRGRRRARLLLAGNRLVLLCLVLLVLAEPVMVCAFVRSPRPQLWVLVDGTDSMAMRDDLPDEQRAQLAALLDSSRGSAGLGNGHANGTENGDGPPQPHSRIEYVGGLLSAQQGQWLAGLEDKFRIKMFLFDDDVRELPAAQFRDGRDGAEKQLTTRGQFTALGTALDELSARGETAHLAGLVVLSDFNQNSGPAAGPAAARLGVPVYPVGVGPPAAADVRVRMETPLWMTKAEKSEITLLVELEGHEQADVQVRVSAQRLDADGMPAGEPIDVGSRQLQLDAHSTPAVFPFTPELTGRFAFTAEVDALPGEVVSQNNRITREVNVRDDFLRLMFVEYEPTWEWRFIKEVFHRDKLVGLRGFRTFLRSSDPKVREENDLFLPSLTPPRSEFFAGDVVFLGDMPAATLSTRFCELLKEFVGTFGGGLVVISGPRFGPGQLAATPLADMLPVVVDPDLRIRDQREFALQLAPEAEGYAFMQLGDDEDENAKAWRNMERVPWYQPVKRAHQRATVLAVHPQDRGVDGQPQPLVAVRQFGKGIVVYLGFNETWRLRRKYGELYYRQFWGQMIHQVAVRHALGTQKRFVVSTDSQQYRVDDQVTLTVEAYDANFQPLPDEKLPEGKLEAEVILPGRGTDAGSRTQLHSVTRRREATLQARFPVDTGGEYRVRVKDPVTGTFAETRFRVSEVSAERLSAVRNASLQTEIAASTGGKSYELHQVGNLVDEIDSPRRVETTIEVVPLWSTWLCFFLVVGLMFVEWLGRKWATLP